MKPKILLLAVFLFLGGSIQNAIAQGLTGRAFYKSSASIQISMDSFKMAPKVMADIQKQLKKQMEMSYVLTFNQAESNWKQEASLGSGPSTAGSGGATIMINTGNEDRLLYKNIGDQTFP